MNKENTKNQHNMTTRSKSKNIENIENKNISMDDIAEPRDFSEAALKRQEIDEHGNLKDFIVYDGDNDDEKAMDSLREILYGIKPNKKKIKKKKRKKNSRDLKNLNNPMGDMFLNYLILKATEKTNEKIKRKRKIKVEEIEELDLSESEASDGDESVVEESEETEESEVSDENESIGEESSELIENDEDTGYDTGEEVKYTIKIGDKLLTEELDDSNSESDEEFLFEYDEYDEELEEVLENHASLNSEEHTMEYFHKLEEEKKKDLIKATKEIYNINDSEVPLRFKIINSCMDLKTKAVAIENIDKLSEMDVSTGEHSKMDHWINGLIKIPFGKYQGLPVNPESSIEEKRSFIKNTYKTLDKAIYGHNEAKTHILQVIGKWIKNPDSGGNVLAIQGPMGNGKTTLVKEGISKVLNRPFAFIALGGASDSAYFDGHCYTYEGSHWGRIVQILQDSKCMNPVIYFDELDKISDTQKGDEIIHMLTHLTDSSQNSLFQDNYFPGINLDLSKALFIFSYNDESRVNKILKDRMYVIHTKGFKTDEKLKISREYLLPDILNTFAFKEDEIIFSDEILKEIVEKFTGGEEGVRNLKRCLESIISKVNICILSEGDELSFKIKDFKLPLEVQSEHLSELLNKGKTDKPPEHMYM